MTPAALEALERLVAELEARLKKLERKAREVENV